jgi:hypothetical protein
MMKGLYAKGKRSKANPFLVGIPLITITKILKEKNSFKLILKIINFKL